MHLTLQGVFTTLVSISVDDTSNPWRFTHAYRERRFRNSSGNSLVIDAATCDFMAKTNRKPLSIKRQQNVYEYKHKNSFAFYFAKLNK
jgi:hypothetical protein